MERFAAVGIAVLLVVSMALPAFAQIDFEGQITGRMQDVEGDNVDQEAGFNEALLNLQVYGEVAAGVDGYAELVGRGAGAGTLIYEAYLTHANLIPATDVKFGRFELNYGDQRNRRTHNASVQANSLIGNAIVDPAVVQTGIELSGQYEMVAWSLGLTNGLQGSDFDEDRDMAIAVKLWGELLPGLSASASYYTVENDDGGPRSNFGQNPFAGEAYSPGDMVGPIIEAEAVDAFQVDLTYDLVGLGLPAELYLNYGQIDFEGNVDVASLPPVAAVDSFDVDYFTVEARYALTPVSHLAVRFSQVDAEDGDGDGGEADRLQIGLGHELAPNTLAKLEYVTQDSDDDVAGEMGEFDGIVGELSISF